MKMPNLNFKKTLVICIILFLFGVLFGFIAFPRILKMGLKKMNVLTPKTDLRDMWATVPFALDFKVYLFNVTNPEEVTKGGKPIVQEVGPYFFEEYKKKVNLEDDEEADTVVFNAVDTFIFNPEKTLPLTGEEQIIFPNILLLGMAIAVSWDKAPMLPLISSAIDDIWKKPQVPFIHVKVMDLLFNGVEVDCSSQEFGAKAVCTAFEDAPQLASVDDNTFKFSFFAAKNGTESLKFKVLRGVKNLQDVNRIIEYDEETEMDVWDGDECNEIRGTDGTVWPPYLDVGKDVYAFSPALCRSIPISYVKKTKNFGIPTYLYTLDFPDARKHEELQCFCRDPPDGCPPAGILDMAPCMEAPLYVSLPHFLSVTDQKVLNSVGGLNPSDELHRTEIHFEKTSGSPVMARQRVQFNLGMVPLEEIPCMNHLPEVYLPLFWIDEGVALNKTYTNMIKHQLIWVLRGNSIIRTLCVLIGVIGGAISGYMLTQQKTVSKVVEPIENNVQVIGQAIGEVEGKKDSAMAFAGSKY